MNGRGATDRVLLALALVLACALPARAQGYPPPTDKPVGGGWRPGRTRVDRPHRPREDWQRASIACGAVLPVPQGPEALTRWFSPAPGLAVEFGLPLRQWIDVRVALESARLPFRDATFRRERGVPTSAPGATSWSAAGVGLRLHPARTGWRPFAEAAVMLPDLSQPTISYRDAQDVFRQEGGSEIFAFDPGWWLGGGVEWRPERWYGVQADTRLWVAPARTRQAVVVTPIRVALVAAIPEWR